jgi:hypothetical protein
MTVAVEPDTGVRFSVSPGGRCCGVVVARVPTATVKFLVLPKFWCPPETRQVVVDWSAGTPAELRLVLHELDDVFVRTGDRGDRARLLDAAMAEAEARGDVDDPDQAEVDSVGSLLVRRGGQIAGQGHGDERLEWNEALAAFTGLAVLSSLLDDFVDYDVAERTREELLRPFLHRAFVNELERQLRQTRRDYVPVEEELPLLRGRASGLSLARFEATGVPLLRCSFDEFTHATDLIRLVVTGLGVVASGSMPEELREMFVVRDTRHRAVALRRTFSDVPALQRRVALGLGRRLRLDRLSRRWDRVRRLAVSLLEVEELAPSFAPATAAEYVELRLRTDRVWERLLLEAAASNGEAIDGNASGSPARVLSPWRVPAPGHAHVDDLVDPLRRTDVAVRPTGSAEWWALDAKYKPFPTEPSSGDAYQQFAYSHLARIHTGVDQHATSRVGLVYPTMDAEGTAPRRRQRQPVTIGHQAVTLTVAAAPFPSSDEARKPDSWGSYKEALAAAVASMFVEPADDDG